ncbi:MAG TPA: four helix bundle protein [bacterium]|nr:four helix bundle protein [bacterium]
MLNLNHKKLDVWNKSIKLVKEIYAITEHFPSSEIYGLTKQLRRAAVSIPSNIAEGSSRSSSIERKRFFEISRSSLAEIDT